MERIAKWLARAGVASRRDSERLIDERRVKMNDIIVETPVTFVTETDIIHVDNVLVNGKQPSRTWIYYKPVGLVTTHYDPEGRPTVFDNLPSDLPRVMSVGRLDLNSEGLLILSNDGAFVHMAEKSDWKRVYRVRVYGEINESYFDELRFGCEIDGIHYKPIEIELDHLERKQAWITIKLIEGKNREIRKVMNYLGLEVSRLIRVAYGDYELKNLQPNEVQEVF
jgi:23S rRNA pseudouridine2605 synthase